MRKEMLYKHEMCAGANNEDLAILQLWGGTAVETRGWDPQISEGEEKKAQGFPSVFKG